MKFAIDIRTLAGPRTGKGNYVFYLLAGLLQVDRKNEYVLYAREAIPELKLPANFRFKIIKTPSFLWHLACLFDFIYREKVDFFLAPTSFIIPAFSKRTVIVVHDLVSFLYLTEHNQKAKWIEKITLKRALKNSRAIISVSENTKRDLLRLFQLSETKVKVVLEAIADRFYEKRSEAEIEAVKRKYHLPAEYFLFVSTLEPRKNILNILKAYELALSKTPNLPKLVMAGNKGWGTEEFACFLADSKLKDQILLPGQIEPQDLSALYQGAILYLFPALYEGFGLTVLEAMASRLPVITSKVSSLPEVAGEAAIHVDPNRPEEIAAVLEKLWQNESLRQELSLKSFEQARKFSLEKQAKEIVETMESVKLKAKNSKQQFKT